MSAAEAESLQALTTPIGFAEQILGMSLYDWQANVLTQLELATGPKGRMVQIAVPAPNGSGKSSGIVAAAALWWASVHKRGKVVITSKDGRQIKEQVWPAIERMKERLPGWTWTELRAESPTGGFVLAFTTNDPGRAEGWHKEDDLDGPLLVIADEAKSIDEPIFTAFDRCTFNALILISSPGGKSGRFWDAVTKLSSLFYIQRVGLKDCPHIPKDKIDRIIQTYGADHPFVKSSVHGEFMSAEDMEEYVVNVDAYDRCKLNPPAKLFDRRVAFCDFAKGKAEHVIAIREGNELVGMECWREADEMAAVGQFIMKFIKWQLRPEDIGGDEGGEIGATMLKLLREAGWSIRRINFGQKAWDERVYVSWGSEAWHEFGKRVLKCDVRGKPLDDDILRAQLTTRKHLVTKEGKLALEDKHALAKRNLPSPDRGDAVAGVFNMWKQDGPRTVPDLQRDTADYFDNAHEPALGGFGGFDAGD